MNCSKNDFFFTLGAPGGILINPWGPRGPIKNIFKNLVKLASTYKRNPGARGTGGGPLSLPGAGPRGPPWALPGGPEHLLKGDIRASIPLGGASNVGQKWDFYMSEFVKGPNINFNRGRGWAAKVPGGP